MELKDPITVLRGVGPKKAEALSKLHIKTLEDLLLTLPREYQDRRHVSKISELSPGQKTTVIARVERITDHYIRSARKQMLRILVSDDTGTLGILFFHARFLKRAFRSGEWYAFYGTVSAGRLGLQMIHPQFSAAEEREEGILPIYPLTQGITQRDMRSWQQQIMPLCEEAEEYLPEDVISRNRLTDPATALRNMHFPEERQKYLEAKFRMIFDELFLLQTGLMAVRAAGASEQGIAFDPAADPDAYIQTLRFPLTGAQQRVVEEIKEDLISSRIMNRLVQGDVGSGKTAVAEAAMYMAVRSGYQAVLMAPTEILARQHYEGISEAFRLHGIRTGFLTGSMRASEKGQLLQELAEGRIDILIGTHAVIQPDVVFARLGLVITDEQHRFGVDQRVRLREKGCDPNVLVMTATPIPRTLAAVIYADLDISVIDEMPPGRTPVRTRCLREESREECYRYAEQEMAAGRQVYVVTPLIDPSETLEVRSAQDTAKELEERFDGQHGHGAFRVALLHGAMKQEEKDRIMEAFAGGEIDLLVSTVVIEVGINVPNATVMIIEDAQRFGLAQMHQLRGRVGRGRYASACFLVLRGDSEIAAARGEIMESTTDGFVIAEEDLKLRGPGDLFGTRQHGLPALAVADLAKHGEVLQKARTEARRVIGEDPNLDKPEHRKLRERVSRMFSSGFTMEL